MMRRDGHTRLIVSGGVIRIVHDNAPAVALAQPPVGREEPSRRAESYPASPAVGSLGEDA